MGIMYLASSPAPKSGGTSPTFFLVLIVLFGLFYVLMIRPQRNRARKAQQVQSQVVPGQRIRTTSGMYGTIVSGDDRDVVIEIAPGVHVSMLRRAVMEVLPDDAFVYGDDQEQQDHGDFDHEFDPQASTDFDASDAPEQPNGSSPQDRHETDEQESKDSSI